MLKMVPWGSLILRFSNDSLVVARSVGETYGMGGQLLSWPFLHSKSFSPLGLLMIVVILVCAMSPFWLMRHRTLTTSCARYSSVFPQEKMDMLKMVPSGSLILRLSGDSLGVTRSFGGRYRMGSWLLSCPFSNSKSFSPSGLLRMVLFLACCQSVVRSRSL